MHNAVSRSEADRVYAVPERCAHEKRVLFMGRVTFQKGPDYFVEAAKLVLDRIPDVRFVMAGSGDMLPNMVRRAAQLRIGSHFHFTGFLKDEEVDHMYAVSDLYVMPSVSEPFGIAPLEAMAYDVPVLISRQSGVAEVVRNAIKVDFGTSGKWRTRSARSCRTRFSPPRKSGIAARSSRPSVGKNVADRLNAIYAQLVSGENDMSALCFIFRSTSRTGCGTTPFRHRRGLLYEDEDANCGIMSKVACKCYLPMNALLADPQIRRQVQGQFLHFRNGARSVRGLRAGSHPEPGNWWPPDAWNCFPRRTTIRWRFCIPRRSSGNRSPCTTSGSKRSSA